eukprot:313755_1
MLTLEYRMPVNSSHIMQDIEASIQTDAKYDFLRSLFWNVNYCYIHCKDHEEKGQHSNVHNSTYCDYSLIVHLYATHNNKYLWEKVKIQQATLPLFESYKLLNNLMEN